MAPILHKLLLCMRNGFDNEQRRKNLNLCLIDNDDK